MSDVPSWVLVFSTLTAAAVGLAPQFIEPRKDREQRKSERIEARLALKIEKLEQLFDQIDIQMDHMSEMIISEGRRLNSDKGRPVLNPKVQGFLDKTQSIVSTHFSEFSPLLDDARNKLRDASSRWNEKVSSGQSDGHEAFEHTADVLGIQSVALAKLRRALFDKAGSIAVTDA